MIRPALFATNRNWNANDTGLLIFRVALGLCLFQQHGWEKLAHFNEMASQHFPDPLHLGVKASLVAAWISDVLCSLLLVTGLATRAAALYVLTSLSVVYFVFEKALSVGFQPKVPPLVMHGPPPTSHMELVFLYMVGVLLLAITGGGRFSLDALLFGARPRLWM